jgi:hypothetical protein
MSKRPPAALVLALVCAAGASAQSHLLYFELQGVAGYSTAEKKAIYHSLSADDIMQKTSLGFDYVLKLSGKSRDIGTLAVQARLAYDPAAARTVEFQIYNAYMKFKAGFADLWVGHNRPALGISYALDIHALLLPTLVMTGFGFDRDWGAGLSRDLSWGNAAFSLTTGSGMPLRFKGNYLAAARVAGGVLSRDNYEAGLSLAGGRILDIIGYRLISEDPVGFKCVSGDLTYLWNNMEARAEVLVGKKDGRSVLALFGKLGVNLFDEGRLKIEAQPLFMKTGADWSSLLSGGVTYQASADLAFRAMVQRDSAFEDTRIVFQIYYYKAL